MGSPVGGADRPVSAGTATTAELIMQSEALTRVGPTTTLKHSYRTAIVVVGGYLYPRCLPVAFASGAETGDSRWV